LTLKVITRPISFPSVAQYPNPDHGHYVDVLHERATEAVLRSIRSSRPQAAGAVDRGVIVAFNVFEGKNISPVAPTRHVVARATPVLDQPLAAHLSEIAAAPALRSTHHERHDRGNCCADDPDHNEGVHKAIRWRRAFVMSTFLQQKPAARRHVARKSAGAADRSG